MLKIDDFSVFFITCLDDKSSFPSANEKFQKENILLVGYDH